MNGTVYLTTVIKSDDNNDIEISLTTRYENGKKTTTIRYFSSDLNAINQMGRGFSVEEHKRIARAIDDMLAWMPYEHPLDKK